METIVIEAGRNDDEQLDIAAMVAFMIGLEIAELASPGNHSRVHQLLGEVAAGERHVPRLDPSIARIGSDKIRESTREIAKRILAFHERLLSAEQAGASS
jgi:hypothetical protein